MRKIIFLLETGYAGMDIAENDTFPDDVTDEQLNQEAWDRAIQHAESYGIYHPGYIEDDSELNDDFDSDDYSDNIEGCWEDYDPEKHDGLVPGGGEWKW